MLVKRREDAVLVLVGRTRAVLRRLSLNSIRHESADDCIRWYEGGLQDHRKKLCSPLAGRRASL
jgi:hypothetical protein